MDEGSLKIGDKITVGSHKMYCPDNGLSYQYDTDTVMIVVKIQDNGAIILEKYKEGCHGNG